MGLTYHEFIQNIIQTRGRFGCGEEYHERHHIVPKCMGGSNNESNLIDLFAREHFEAHRLLALENPNESRLQYAWWMMAHVKDENQERYEVTAEEYEEARIAFSQLRQNTKASDLTREKMSKAHSGKNNSFYGKKHTVETRKKIKEARAKQVMRKGFHWSEEVRHHMSQSQKGIQANGKHPLAKKVECDGKVFDCIKLCAEYYNINPYTMRAWLNGHNPMPQKFKDLGLKHWKGDD